jgi:hypothetical protein
MVIRKVIAFSTAKRENSLAGILSILKYEHDIRITYEYPNECDPIV